MQETSTNTPNKQQRYPPMPLMPIWLGARYGYLQDWITQQWVAVTGRWVELNEQPWIDGPAGTVQGGIHPKELSETQAIPWRGSTPHIGLLPDFSEVLT